MRGQRADRFSHEERSAVANIDTRCPVCLTPHPDYARMWWECDRTLPIRRQYFNGKAQVQASYGNTQRTSMGWSCPTSVLSWGG